MIPKNLENFFKKQERPKRQIQSRDKEILELFVRAKTQEEIQKIERWLLR